jgi:hypothetical protein
MRFHGVIVGVALALLAASASGADKCWTDTEKGPWTCNCTDSTVHYTGCSSSDVKVMSGNEGGVTGTFPGLSATAKWTYSLTVSTGDSECLTADIPPHQCAWLEYHFKLCLTQRIEDHWWGDSVVNCVTPTYLGKSLKSEPAPPGAC